MAKISKSEALKYHMDGRPGKIEVVPTKPHSTQHDLSLAYTPGVAQPCLEIHKNVDDVYKYTSKGNLVAVEVKKEAEGVVVRMQALGKKFDPYLHDVVSHVESEKPLGEIVQIVQDGYNLNGKVLRHAVVIVSNGKKEEKKTEKENEEECDVDTCPSC